MTYYARLRIDYGFVGVDLPEKWFPPGTLLAIEDATRPGYAKGRRFRGVVAEEPGYDCFFYGAHALRFLSPLEALATLTDDTGG